MRLLRAGHVVTRPLNCGVSHQRSAVYGVTRLDMIALYAIVTA
jgi:hypothetical protein